MNKLAEKIRVDIVRFDANTIERDLTEAAAELDRLTRELADARAVDVHSCHDKCTMPGCVNRRLRAEVAGLRECAIDLWMMLDDIDTGGDRAKADDVLYRAIAERTHRRRFSPKYQIVIDAIDAARKGEA